jgi:hypothetical protein
MSIKPMNVKLIASQLEESITDNFNTHYWLYSLYEKINDIKWNGNIYEELLFKSIKFDGISVNVILVIVNNKFIELQIQSDRIMDNNIGEITLYYEQMLIDAPIIEHLVFWNYINSFIKIDTVLRTFKFDKFSGKFVNLKKNCSCITNNILKKKALVRMSKNNTNIITNCDLCVVCYESTTNLTCCNHIVCFVCLDKIAQNINVNRTDLSPFEQPLLCPICRNNINENN